ncbi:MAG: MBL fold metallo-hydrolase [Deltaproteobacteria bacterium]|nr:MAG: MBL fold metallo-hydrolase [Deltaproteobacteria bacterium]
MRIRKPGKIRDHLWYLGCEESGVYLLEGQNESMIISGGISYILPHVLQQIRAFGIKEDRIRKFLILHAHFDHVGILPLLKRRHPELQIYGSSRAWEILSMPKAIKTINAFSAMVTERMGRVEECSGLDLEWREDVDGASVSEGDLIGIDDIEVQIFETPGHSSCSISAYVPKIKALFPSDGGGIPYRDTIITPGNSNFTLFQQSLEKLKDLDVEYLCADHYGYIAGEEAGGFIQQTIQMAKQNRSLMEEAYLKTRDVETAAHELVTSFYELYPDYVLSREIFQGIYGQMVKHIAKNLG